MNTAYSTFTGRSRASKGKNFFGLTAGKLKSLQQVREDTSTNLSCHAENLFTFAGIYIQHARDLAKSGFKDEARNWYRFFNCSQLVGILTDLKVSNTAPLAESIHFLGLECHPLDPVSFTTDIEALRHCLNEILSHVQKTSPKTETVRRFNPGRARNGQPSRYRHRSKISTRL